MSGRGIDQILPHPAPSRIYEPVVTDARDYVVLAERLSGSINFPVSFEYIWGEALGEIQKAKPQLKIVNLETAITKSENYSPKGINYRMNPKNIEIFKVLGVDACVLANNHILDWGKAGLIETINVLKSNDIALVGAGKNLRQAKSPAIFNFAKGRIIIFAYAHPSSGVPHNWQAKESCPGVNLLADLADKEFSDIKTEIASVKQKKDFLIFSIHWGSNWGYAIDQTFIDFAHRLIDFAGVDMIFGHSAHHFRGFEIYKDKLILYGAGDFINDYEGISGYEEFRGDITLMYFPEVDLKTKNLAALTLVPMRIKKFRLTVPQHQDIDWSLDVLRRESKIKGNLIKTGRRLQLL